MVYISALPLILNIKQFLNNSISSSVRFFFFLLYVFDSLLIIFSIEHDVNSTPTEGNMFNTVVGIQLLHICESGLELCIKTIGDFFLALKTRSLSL